MQITLEQLAAFLNATYTGDGAMALTNVAKIEDAEQGTITFLANPKYTRYLDVTKASAVIVNAKTEVTRTDIGVITMSDPYYGFVRALQLFNPPLPLLPEGMHPAAAVAQSAALAEGVRVGACAVIGERAKIGERTIICGGAFVGDDVEIGCDAIIYPNASILRECKLGDRVIIHSGAVIGSDGFGFVPQGKKWEKIPQLGNVVIDDDVEIGSNSSVDRATIGSTHIKRGVKIDNLVQVAHNVTLGEDVIIAAQSGVSGSAIVGNHVILAGQVGVVGHIEIANDVTVTAQSGVSKSLTDVGKTYRGSPAKEFHEELRMEAAMRQLPELIKAVRLLEEKIEKLRDGKVLN